MPRHRISHPRARGPKRKFEWAHTNYQSGAAAVTGSVDLMAGLRTALGIMSNLPDWTAVRIRGIIQCGMVAGVAPSYTSACLVGVYVENRAAAPPSNPFAQPYLDWMMYQNISPGVLSGYLPANTGLNYGSIIDVKSMRKLHELDDSLWLTWHSQDAALLQVSAYLSVGFKLP